MKRLNLQFSLRLLALILWLNIPVFVITVLGPHFSFLKKFTPEFRGSTYQWDFELMFMVIFLVWGWYLWKASFEPKKHSLFIDFSIWANIAHGLTMILIGLLREGELIHLLKDSVVLLLPAILLFYSKRREDL
jgi:hypothetical protein